VNWSRFNFRTLFALLAIALSGAPALVAETTTAPSYSVVRDAKVPCNIHVIKIPRDPLRWEVRTTHAYGKALGLEKLTAQLQRLESEATVAAINGDYYVRQGTFAGDPRGLQIVNGELISGPTDGVSFWIDALDHPNIGTTSARFSIEWPDGSSTPYEMNAPGDDRSLVLLTPAAGSSIKSRGGTDIILERHENQPWLPLRPGRVYSAKVQRLQKSRELRIDSDTLALSVGRRLSIPKLSQGAIIKISTHTEPSLRGVSEALSGGPILVRDRKKVPIKTVASDSYIFSSMRERHPRSAIGWNDHHFFLVSVDGRQPGVSEGLTLDELSVQLIKLGCTHAINLDGGGSATLWYDGKIRNFLCDGYERKIANGLSFVERKLPER
jgi:exopolysaccharide biosynthesis protein